MRINILFEVIENYTSEEKLVWFYKDIRKVLDTTNLFEELSTKELVN